VAASAHATGQFCSKFIECIEQVQSGVLKVTISTIGGVGNIYPAGQVLDIPYYVGFAVVAALAWRDRFSLPMIGLSLMAYGFVLELAQELVPTCTFRVKDLVGSRIWRPTPWVLVWVYHGYICTTCSRVPSNRRRRRSDG
jgi:hypothetical protein